MRRTEVVNYTGFSNQTLRQPICKENLNVFWGTMRFETMSKLSANHLKPCVFIYDKLGRLDKKTFGSKSVEVVRKHLTAKI
jgi:hypothetical protein